MLVSTHPLASVRCAALAVAFLALFALMSGAARGTSPDQVSAEVAGERAASRGAAYVVREALPPGNVRIQERVDPVPTIGAETHSAVLNPIGAPANASEAEVLRLTNEARNRAGLPPLAWDERLAQAARSHAADMESDDYFDHDTFDRVNGQLVRVGSARERIRSFAEYGAAENIARGQKTAEGVMEDWMGSPPHRKNILRQDVTKVGIGLVGKTWVQNFGW